MARKNHMAKNDTDFTTVKTGDGFEVRQKTGTVETFDGKTLSPAIPYTFDYTVYTTLDAAKKSEDWPSENAVWSSLGTDSERSAKATAYQAATAKLREAKMKTPEYQLEQLIKNAVAMEMPLDEATAFVHSTKAGARLLAEIAAK